MYALIPIFLFPFSVLVTLALFCRYGPSRIYRLRYKPLASVPSLGLVRATPLVNIRRDIKLTTLRRDLLETPPLTNNIDDDIREFDTLRNAYNVESSLEKLSIRPEISDVSLDSMSPISVVIYDNPLSYYTQLLLANSKASWHFPWFIRYFVNKYTKIVQDSLVNIKNIVSRFVCNFHNCDYSIHTPTVHQVLISNFFMLESSYRNFKLTLNHKPSPSERSYFWCVTMFPRILNHLQTREVYCYSAQTMLPVAIATLYCFLEQTGRALPFMYPGNLLGESSNTAVHSLKRTVIKGIKAAASREALRLMERGRRIVLTTEALILLITDWTSVLQGIIEYTMLPLLNFQCATVGQSLVDGMSTL